MNKTEILQARFPTLGITVGYIGNIWHNRDDRAFKVFTNLPGDFGGTVSIDIENSETFDVEEVALELQNIVVHQARRARGDLKGCKCRTCFSNFVRQRATDRIVNRTRDALEARMLEGV